MNKTAICGLRAALVIVFLLILLALGALILVGNYFYTFALDPNAKGGFRNPRRVRGRRVHPMDHEAQPCLDQIQ